MKAGRLVGPPRVRCSPRRRLRCPARGRATCESRRGPSTGRQRRAPGSSCSVAAEREARVEDEAASVGGSCGHLSAEDLDAFADADEPWPRPSVVELPTPLSRTLSCTSPVAHGYVGFGRAGVLERVRQAFLNEAIGREVDPARQRDRLAVQEVESAARDESPLLDAGVLRAELLAPARLTRARGRRTARGGSRHWSHSGYSKSARTSSADGLSQTSRAAPPSSKRPDRNRRRDTPQTDEAQRLRAGFWAERREKGSRRSGSPLSCEWTGRSRLTSLYVSQAPRTFGSRQPVSKVPSIGSVMPLVVSVIETLVYTT
jgi:hypothetical protein